MFTLYKTENSKISEQGEELIEGGLRRKLVCMQLFREMLSNWKALKRTRQYRKAWWVVVVHCCISMNTCLRVLQRLPLTRDLSPSKESGKVAFWWTSIKEKPLELFWIFTRFQGNSPRNWEFYLAERRLKLFKLISGSDHAKRKGDFELKILNSTARVDLLIYMHRWFWKLSRAAIWKFHSQIRYPLNDALSFG